MPLIFPPSYQCWGGCHVAVFKAADSTGGFLDFGRGRHRRDRERVSCSPHHVTTFQQWLARVHYRQDFSYQLPIQNSTDAPWTVDHIETSCTCTAPKAKTKTVGPHQTAYLPLMIEPIPLEGADAVLLEVRQPFVEPGQQSQTASVRVLHVDSGEPYTLELRCDYFGQTDDVPLVRSEGKGRG